MALVANALTTVATLAGELGIAVPAGSSSAEADLERRIAVASSAIERYCGRTFGKATLTEKVKGYGTKHLRLSRPPLLSITSVSFDGEELETTEYLAPAGNEAEAGLLVADRLWWWTAQHSAGASDDLLPGTERLLYEVVYVGGYVLPKDDGVVTPRTLPHEVEEACLRACTASYLSRGRDLSVVSETLLAASRTYAAGAAVVDPESGLPLEVVAMLKPFRMLP